jgi:rhodanese-related sulfurtransferase
MQINIQQIRTFLADTNLPVVLIDVRTHDELFRLRSVGALSVPFDGRGTTNFAETLTAYKHLPIVCLCVRYNSKRADAMVEQLRSVGFDAYNLVPGLTALHGTDYKFPVVENAPKMEFYDRLKVYQLT